MRVLFLTFDILLMDFEIMLEVSITVRHIEKK